MFMRSFRKTIYFFIRTKKVNQNKVTEKGNLVIGHPKSRIQIGKPGYSSPKIVNQNG